MGTLTDCVAIDIGASGGRILLGSLTGERMSVRNIRRFPNVPLKRDGRTLWDLDSLFDEMSDGVAACLPDAKTRGRLPKSLGIDTWGVDYVIARADGTLRGECFSYRDARTEGVPERVFRMIGPERLYQKTGIQIRRFNTLFQLASVTGAEYGPDDRFLMIPDWLHFRLTGATVNEFTNLTTTQLCARGTGKTDGELLAVAGARESLFPRAVAPGAQIGCVRATGALAGAAGLPVIAPATHDTASAVAAIPDPEGGMPLFVSSGTWSLMGAETERPVVTDAAFRANFTNEGGAGGRNRLLKNIMGLWLLQRVRAEAADDPSFDDLERLARGEEPFRSLVDPQDGRFLDPQSMTAAIRARCAERGEPVPDTTARLARCVYDSLALSYRATLAELEAVTGRRFARLHVIGGGSQDRLLCQLAADATGLEVIAGPAEATAIGNCLIQFMGQGAIPSLSEGRAMVRESFGALRYESRETPGLENASRRFAAIAESARSVM